MLDKLITWARKLVDFKVVHLAIVRRYADANGSYVGELYMQQDYGHASGKRAGFVMIGASLDSLPLELGESPRPIIPKVDLLSDFLVPMPKNIVRVGSLEPKDNDSVRTMIRNIRRRNLRLVIQNRFIEHVLNPNKGKHGC